MSDGGKIPKDRAVELSRIGQYQKKYLEIVEYLDKEERKIANKELNSTPKSGANQFNR